MPVHPHRPDLVHEARSRARAAGGSSARRAGRARARRPRPAPRRATRRTRAARGSAPDPSPPPASETTSRPRRARRSRAPGPCASEPQTGWPPMNRARSPTEVRDAALRRADVRDRRRVAGSRPASPRPAPGSVVTGVATMASSASATASARDGAASSTAPRSRATPSDCSLASHPTTDATPARFAASPTEAPIRPVPTIASRVIHARVADDVAHEGRERADLVGEVAEVGRRDLLRPRRESACSGCGCTSTMIPSAPAATAARASGATRSRRPGRVRGIDDHR